MSGVAVMAELLRGFSPLTDTLPAPLIVEDELAQGAARGVVLESISVVDIAPLTDGDKRRVRERVRATVMEPSVRARRATWNLVRAGGAARRGDFAGVTQVSVVLDGGGPPVRISDPTLYLKSQDFLVSFNEAI